MSRTYHKARAKKAGFGREYWSRYKCNRYGGCYGSIGRSRANKERRNESKRLILQAETEFTG